MSSLDPSIKNVLLILLLIAISFVFFIILLVLTYKKRQTKFVIEARLKEAELKEIKLQGEIETLKAINLEKERISDDIHDDMGSNVASINLLSKLLQKDNTNDLTRDRLKEMQFQSLELNQKMKDIIWTTKSENDTLESLIYYLHQYAIKQLEPLGINLLVIKPENIPGVIMNGEMRKDLFMSIKECINNIIKHSGAKHVTLDLKYELNQLIISIQDDGKGLDEIIQYGNGLKQIRKRINKHQGTIRFENKNGLHILIEIYISISSAKL